jgi:hypothetical protein
MTFEKVGTGTLNYTGASTFQAGTLIVAQGTMDYSGAGTTAFLPTNVLAGGTLELDNSGTNVNDRLGGGPNHNLPVNVNISGGTLQINGNASYPTTENIIGTTGTVGTISLIAASAAGGLNVIQLNPNASQPLSLNIGTMTGLAGQGYVLVRSGTVNSSGVVTGSNPVGGGPTANGSASLLVITPAAQLGAPGRTPCPCVPTTWWTTTTAPARASPPTMPSTVCACSMRRRSFIPPSARPI